MKIPLVDLKAQYHAIKPEIDAAIASVIDDTAFIRGKYVTDFEKAYAEKYGVRHCIGVGNGTDAISITLKALGIGSGDEVITVANSWISTSETITQVGAKPVFVDIDPDYYTINSSLIEAKITARTKAVIPVHIYGQPVDIEAVKSLCAKHRLHLVEDCAQSHFSTFKGQKVGTFGIAGTFSFYPGKNLGAYGDAGAIITNDDRLAETARMYANHGSLKKHHHLMEGVNSRLDGLQAAILSAKLPHIDDWNRLRRGHARTYNSMLSSIPGIALPKIRPDVEHIFHLYVIRTPRRDDLQKRLKENGIDTEIHYPTALPFLPAYGYLGHKPADFPVASRYQNEILSLPMYPELSQGQIEHVVKTVKEFFAT